MSFLRHTSSPVATDVAARQLQLHSKPRDCVRCQRAGHRARYKPWPLLLDGMGDALVDASGDRSSSSGVRIAKNPEGVYEFRCTCCEAFASTVPQRHVLIRRVRI